MDDYFDLTNTCSLMISLRSQLELFYCIIILS